MLKIEITRNMTGIKLFGDYYDLEELVEVIHRLTPHGDDAYHPYYGVENRLLSFCFDVRYAYMGQRETEIVDNGFNEYNKHYHQLKTDDKTVYYSCQFLLPEVMFLMCSLPELMMMNEAYCIKEYSYMQYLKDKAYMNMLISLFEEVLYDIIGEDEFRKLKKYMRSSYFEFIGYVTHYVDKCNIEYIKTPMDKRAKKIKSIVKRYIDKPIGYLNMEEELLFFAKEYECSIYDLDIETLQYPDTIEW